jgi:hypothetical protein
VIFLFPNNKKADRNWKSWFEKSGTRPFVEREAEGVKALKESNEEGPGP